MTHTIKYTMRTSLLLLTDILTMIKNNGGTIYIGIEENGNVVGLSDANLVMREVDMAIVNAYPELIMSTHSRIEIIEGKEVVRLDVALDGYVEEYIYYNHFYKETKNTFIPINQFETTKYRVS